MPEGAGTLREVQAKVLADKCIAVCKEREADPYLLFSLRHWGWLDGSRFGSKFKAFIELNTALTARHMQCKEFREAFERRVEHVLNKQGIVNLAPTRKVEAYRKQELMDKYHGVRDSWPPHIPYLLQMRPGPYILLSNFQAAFHLLRAMALTGKYQSQEGQFLDVGLLYEGQLVGEPHRIILDCDAYLKDFEGLFSAEELRESVLQVPQVLVRELVRIGAISRDATVLAIEKDKSRGDKVSFHFTLNIVGVSTGDLKAMFARLVLEPYGALFSQCKKEKSKARLARLIAKSRGEDGVYAHALAHVDPATVHGQHQFSVAFSRKRGEEPPRMGYVQWISKGGAEVNRVESSLHGVAVVPSHNRALTMLYLGGFTHWTPRTVVLDRKFQVASTDLGLAPLPGKKRALGQSPAAASASGSDRDMVPSKDCSLPQWMKSALSQRPGQVYSENSQMGSLQSRYKSLLPLVPDALPEDMVHVIGGVYCPVSVLYGNPSMHTSNGVYLARRLVSRSGDGWEVVYASCAHCVYDKTLALPKDSDRLAEIVPGGEDMQYPWVAYTPLGYPRIIMAAAANTRSHTHTATKSNARIPKKHKAEDR